MLAWADNARMPLFADVLRDLELSDAVGSLLFSCGSGGQILGSLAGGRLLQRREARGLLGVALVVVAAGTALVALAPAFPLLLLGALIYGLGCGVVVTAQNLIVERETPPGARRRAFAGLHAMYALASLLAPLAAVALREQSGWRVALLCAGLPSLGLALLAPLSPRVPPRAPSGVGGPAGPLRPRLLIGALVAAYVLAELSLSTRLPLLFQRQGAAPQVAAGALSLFFACLLLGRVASSLITWPLANRPLLVASAGSALLLYLGGLLVEPWLLPLTALPMAPFFPTAMALLAEELPDELPAALGTLMALVSVALVLGQVALGALTDALGLRAALGLGPAALAVTLLLLLATGRRPERGPP